MSKSLSPIAQTLLYNPPMDKPNYSIVITGEWPGAGQSTTASHLAQKLHYTRVYAGFLFRKFGFIWNLEKKRLTWQQFEQKIAHNQLDLDSYQFTESDFSEELNHQFQYQLKSVNTPELWDKIIDQQSLKALSKPGNVVEGKVGVLLDKTGLVKNFKPTHPVYKFLLTCPPEISAHRIIKRQIHNNELPQMDQEDPAYLELVRQTTTNIIERHLRDWERYEKIYGILRSDIYKPGIIKVSTADRAESSVVSTIISIISQKQSSS